MQAKIIGATEFKADCLRLIARMAHDRQPVTITKRGRPVATLSPIASGTSQPIVGAMRGTVLRYDDPFGPALEPADWNA